MIKKIIKESLNDFDWTTGIPARPKIEYGLKFYHKEYPGRVYTIGHKQPDGKIEIRHPEPYAVHGAELEKIQSLFDKGDYVLIKESDEFDWVTQHMETVPDEPHYLALASCYGPEVLMGMDENDVGTHYGLDVYTNEDGDEYAVGDVGEFDDALSRYYDDLLDDVGLDGWNVDVGYYFFMSPTDIRIWSGEMADSDMDGLDDEDILPHTDLYDEYNELGDRIIDLEYEISQKEEEFESLEDDAETDEEIDFVAELADKIADMYSDLKDLERDRGDVLFDAREEYREDRYNEYKQGLEDDPVDFLINTLGFYESLDDLKDLLSFDRESFIDDLVSNEFYGELSSYDGEYCMEHINGEDYICIRIH